MEVNSGSKHVGIKFFFSHSSSFLDKVYRKKYVSWIAIADSSVIP